MTHPLKHYRDKVKVTLEQLGERVGVSKSYLSKIERGRQIPSLSTAAKIEKATDGAVTPNDFVEASEGPTDPAKSLAPAAQIAAATGAMGGARD
jgi:transcriptional regulator with XRE-family HTH domain